MKVYISLVLFLASYTAFSQTNAVSSEINKPTQLFNEESQVKKDSVVMEISNDINSGSTIRSVKTPKKEKENKEIEQSAIEERRKKKF